MSLKNKLYEDTTDRFSNELKYFKLVPEKTIYDEYQCTIVKPKDAIDGYCIIHECGRPVAIQDQRSLKFLSTPENDDIKAESFDDCWVVTWEKQRMRLELQYRFDNEVDLDDFPNQL